MQVMGTLPTTVSSNVVMTGQAGGDQAATTIEVMCVLSPSLLSASVLIVLSRRLGNLVGTFLTPALLQLFLNGNLSFGRPQAAGGGGTGQLYKNILAQLGYSVFIPLFVGEVIQYFFPRQTKWTREKFRLGKVGSFCLLLVIWCVNFSSHSFGPRRCLCRFRLRRSTFSGAFHTGAFTTITGEAVALIVGTNVFLYLCTLPPFFPLLFNSNTDALPCFQSSPSSSSPSAASSPSLHITSPPLLVASSFRTASDPSSRLNKQ